MLLFDIVLLIPLTVILYLILRNTPKQYRMTLSLWLAFYISVPLFIFDYFYCGLYLGHGWSFLITYWYLTIYYLIPWLLCPALAHFIHWNNWGQTRI